jgi:hypothetical protein
LPEGPDIQKLTADQNLVVIAVTGCGARCCRRGGSD